MLIFQMLGHFYLGAEATWQKHFGQKILHRNFLAVTATCTA